MGAYITISYLYCCSYAKKPDGCLHYDLIFIAAVTQGNPMGAYITISYLYCCSYARKPDGCLHYGLIFIAAVTQGNPMGAYITISYLYCCSYARKPDGCLHYSLISLLLQLRKETRWVPTLRSHLYCCSYAWKSDECLHYDLIFIAAVTQGNPIGAYITISSLLLQLCKETRWVPTLRSHLYCCIYARKPDRCLHYDLIFIAAVTQGNPIDAYITISSLLLQLCKETRWAPSKSYHSRKIMT